MTAEQEPREPHPFEGKYLVFKYTEADYDHEETIMLLYKVEGGKFKGIITPFNWGSVDSEERDSTEQAVAYLQHFGVTEVSVVDFRGSSLEGFNMRYEQWDTLEEEEGDEDEVQNWAELSILENGGWMYDLLSDAGISVKYIDMRSEAVREVDDLVNRFLGIPEGSLPFQPQE